MKKALLLAGFCFLLTCSARADEFAENYGIGVIHVSLDSLIALDLWESPDDKVPVHSIVTRANVPTMNVHHFSFDGLKEDSVPSWFTPLVFYVNNETFRLEISCIGENAQYYKTNLKCESGKYIWIGKEKHVQFLPWLNFYLSMASVEYAGDTVAIFEQPTLRSGRYNFNAPGESHRIEIIPLEVKGSWMKVELFDANSAEEKRERKYGWIRWRDEKRPLIKFNIMGC